MVIESPPRTTGQRIRTIGFDGLLRKGVWGLCDQALISASNFVTTVVLARVLAPTDFGAFTLVYAAIFFAIALQAALITRPHNVLGPTHSGAVYRRYTTATAMSQIALTGMLAVVALVAAVAGRAAAWGVAPLLIPLVPALVAWQLQEFIRRVLYTEGRLRAAFANDLVSYGAQAVGIGALAGFGRLTGPRALSVIALTSAIAAAWGVRTMKDSFDRRAIRNPMREKWIADNWRFGKWIFGATLVSSASSQFYPVLLGGFVSLAEAGVFRAVLTLFGPARILLLAMETALTPAAARVFAERGQAALHSFIGRVVTITAPIMAGYGLVASVLATPILVTLYGDRYRPYGWLLICFALAYALAYLQVPALIALEGRQASAPVFHASLWSGLAALIVAVVAVRLFGLLGAALGAIVEPLVSNTVLWLRYRRLTAAPGFAEASAS